MVYRALLGGFLVLSASVSVVWGATIETVVWGSDQERIIDTTVPGEQIFLSELNGAPQQYVLTLEATTTLAVSLRTAATAELVPDFGLLIIKDAPVRGVMTVARLTAGETNWVRQFDRQFRIEYLAGQTYTAAVGPGTYRIEVSTPVNSGRYELRLGVPESLGWWQSLSLMYTLQHWYGIPWWQLVFSPLIYIPLGFILIFFGGGYYLIYRYRQYGRFRP